MVNINEPTATAFRWNIVSGGENPKEYELACFAELIFSAEIGFRTVYKEIGGDWKYLLEPSIYESDDFDTKTTEILDEISKKVRTFFLLNDIDVPVPSSLFDRVEYLLRSGVKWEDGVLLKK